MAIPTAIWLVLSHDNLSEMRAAQVSFARTVSANYKLRIVRSIESMIEEILLFDAGLNDLVIHLLKFHYIENTDNRRFGPWYFSGVSNEQSEKRILFKSPSSKLVAAAPMNAGYQQLVAKINGVTPEREWLEATSEQAMKLMQGAE